MCYNTKCSEKEALSGHVIPFLIGGAHQQTGYWAAPPVSVEEKGKTIGENRKLLLFLLTSIQN
jgi:hypothetical protein